MICQTISIMCKAYSSDWTDKEKSGYLLLPHRALLRPDTP